VSDEVITGALVALAVCVMVGAALARLVRRALRREMHRWERRLTRRVVAALAFVVFGRWLHGRGQRRPVRPPALEGDDIYRACPLSAWTGDPAACRWCNGLLPERATRWCTARCRIRAEQNHVYRLARDAALERDGHRCTRRRCGAGSNLDRAVETNHIVLARGRHDQPGCIHHLDNLESLCGYHHDEVTAGQRARGWAS